MKKLLLLVLILVLGTALAACGSDKAENEKVEDNSANSDASKDEPVTVESDALENEYFQSVIALLESKGYEITNVQAGDATFFKANSSINMVVNGEDILTLEIFDLDPSDENLAKGKETGVADAYFGGQSGEIPVVVKDHYFFSMAEGHPDYADIFKIIDEEL